MLIWGALILLLAGPVLRAQEYTYTDGENHADPMDTFDRLTLSVPTGFSATQSGVISGPGAVIVNSDPANTGSLTFAGMNTYEGNTHVANGSLTVSGAIVNGTVTTLAPSFVWVSGTSSITVGNADPAVSASMTVSNGGSVVTRSGRVGGTVSPLGLPPGTVQSGVNSLTVDGADSSWTSAGPDNYTAMLAA